MAHAIKRKARSAGRGIIGAATDAAQEIGQAAAALRESWEHVERARKKGAPFTHAAARVGKTAARTVKKGVSKLVRTAKRGASSAKRSVSRATGTRSRTTRRRS